MTPALLLAAVALAAPVPKDVSLTWKWNAGDVFYVRYESESVSTVNADATLTTTHAFVLVYKVAVKSVKAGETVLELTFESCHGAYFRGRRGPKVPEVPGVAGKAVTLTLDEKQKVTKVTGADGVADVLVGGNRHWVFSESGLKSAVSGLLASVPDTRLSADGKWGAEVKEARPEGLTAAKAVRGKLGGVTDGVATLLAEVDYTCTGTDKTDVTYDLKGEKGQSTVLFDTKTGRLKRREESLTISGTLEYTGPGKGWKSTLTQVLKTTESVSDKPPKDE